MTILHENAWLTLEMKLPFALTFCQPQENQMMHISSSFLFVYFNNLIEV